jgi:para-nitrobenzyl esterase
MPFAPYLLCEKTNFLGCATLAEQPALSDFTVPTVLGVNGDESNSFGMLPSLTFLIPKIIELIGEENLTDPEDPEQVAQDISDWLATESNVQKVTNTLVSGSPSSDGILDCLNEDTTEAILECLASSITLPTTAYEPVTKLFFGLGNDEITQGTAVEKGLLRLADYFPNSESNLSGATKNMSQFKGILNNMLFDGPARLKVQQESDSGQQVALYHFEYTPSFNVWSYDTANSGLLDIIKGIGCISGACNSSELPFVFNKGVKLDGSEVTPSKKDRALMAKMSRLWFSDALFTDYQYSTASDNVVIIDADGPRIENDWDASTPGVDPALRGGVLNGLNDLGLFLGYFD